MNRRLVLGLLLLGLLALLALVGPSFAPFPADFSQSLRVVTGADGSKEVVFAPEAPNSLHPFGTDRYGYDMASNLLRGLRWTLVVVFGAALLRAGLGLGFGAAAALDIWSPRERRRFSPLSAIPSFIIAYFILYPFSNNPVLPASWLVALQTLVIALLELPAQAAGFAARGREIASRSFVEAARASGAAGLWLLRKHILPNLWDDFIEALPRQAMSVAAFVARLGIFSLFIGGTIIQYDPIPAAMVILSAKQELLGLMGAYARYFPERWWLFVGPFVCWLLVLAAAELLAAGARVWHEGRERRLGSLEEEGS